MKKEAKVGAIHLLADIMEKTPKLPGDAACKDLSPTEVDLVFFDQFPSGETARPKKRKENAIKARGICGKCGSREACLSHALTKEIPYGTWGGVTADERKELLKGKTKLA